MITQEYAPGRNVDLHGSLEHGIALLWHGRGVDQRTSMHPLARRLAQSGVLALTPDWNSESSDGGRADLLASLRHARDVAESHAYAADSVIVMGWSLGGTAALSLAMHAKRLGISIGGAVLVAPGDSDRVIDPISGSALPARFPPGAGQCQIDVAYGVRDELATPDLVTGLELRLRAAGWATALHSVDADHASIIGTRYEASRERYVASGSTSATAAVDTVTKIVVTATSSRGSQLESSPVAQTGRHHS